MKSAQCWNNFEPNRDLGGRKNTGIPALWKNPRDNDVHTYQMVDFKLKSLRKLQYKCTASVKKQTYQSVDYIPEGRGAFLHQAKEMLSLGLNL